MDSNPRWGIILATMKTPLVISALILPLLFTACKSDQPTEEQVESGVEKISEGLKDVGTATREAARDTGEKISDAAKDVKQEIHERTAPE